MNIFNCTEEIIPAGSIVMWKNYNIFKRLWYKLRNKRLPYNSFNIWDITGPITLPNFLKFSDFVIYSPVKPYSSKQIFKLLDAMYVQCEDCEDEQTIINIVNDIRKNTINTNSLESLSNNQYYYKLYGEYI